MPAGAKAQERFKQRLYDTMDTIRVSAPAKINLTLDVLGRRPDGYHDLATIMHEIPLSDDITVNIGGEKGIRAVTDVSYIRNDTNVAAKAARLFFEYLEDHGKLSADGIGILIEIKKKIPVGAGLGGGSADAAAVLKALNSYFGSPLSQSELIGVGASTGADVPFCIAGGCALCEGIGEIITPLPVLSGGYLVLVKPKISISTAELFSGFGSSKKQIHPDTAGAIKALSEGDLKGVASRAFNALERAAEDVGQGLDFLVDDGLPFNLSKQGGQRDGYIGGLEYREGKQMRNFVKWLAVNLLPLGNQRNEPDDE
jgi:4-diphosphocytidyl-2-C-methyl-D-erythritol kinase